MSAKVQVRHQELARENIKTLIGHLWILLVGCAVVVGLICLQGTQAQKVKPTERPAISVGDSDVSGLDTKLRQFEGRLSSQELGAMKRLLLRAAAAPLDNPAGNDIKAAFFDVRGPGAVADENGDRGGGRPPGQGRIASTATSGLIVAQDREPNRPPPPPPESVNSLKSALGVVVQGGIQPDTINTLAGKLRAFGGSLSNTEKGIMNWLMDRAGRGRTVPQPGTVGGQPLSLAQALGIAAFGSRAASAGGQTWTLRFAQQF